MLLACLAAEGELGCLWPGDVCVLLLAELNSLLSLLLAVVVDCLIGCCCCWDERGCLRPGDVLALQLVLLASWGGCLRPGDSWGLPDPREGRAGWLSLLLFEERVWLRALAVWVLVPPGWSLSLPKGCCG